MTEWISVKIRYPKNGEMVKIKLPNAETDEILEVVAIFTDADDYRSWKIKGSVDLYKTLFYATPTHWMPLPKLPEGK